jgi:hypothetical protein
MRLCAAVLTAVLCTTAFAQAPAVRERLGVEVQLDFVKRDIVVGETLFLELTVRNVSQSLKVGTFQSKLYYSEGNDITIIVQAPGDLPQRYEGVHSGLFSVTEANLVMGEYMHWYFPILYSPNSPDGLALGRPGEYTVAATINFTVLRQPDKTPITTGPTKITVRAPEGADAAALKLLDVKEAVEAMHRLETFETTVAERIRQIADQFPDSALAPVATYTLAETLRESGDLEGSIARFRTFVQRHASHPLAAGAAYGAMRAYDQMGQYDFARDWMYFIMDIDPGFVLLRPENPLMKRYYFENEIAYENRRWWLYLRPWELNIPLPEAERQ